MVEIFHCARAEVYHNSGKKTLTQVKKETGCTHIINGYLFNSSFRPLGWTVIDGKIISRDAYRDWGVSIGADRRPVMDTDRGGSFLSGVPLLKNGQKLKRELTADVARSAARTAVGWMPDGQVVLWCDKTSLTRDQLRAIYRAVPGLLERKKRIYAGVMEELDRQIDLALPRELVLDLAGLTFTDSSGIAVLLRAWKAMLRIRGGMKIVNTPDQAARVFRAAGLQRMLRFQ